MAVVDWATWRPQESAVLVFVVDGPQALLIHKKRGLGRGKIVAPGGRVEPQERWEEAALRETQEETGLIPGPLSWMADLKFQFVDGYALEVRGFQATGWTGVLTACDEADPFWHPVSRLPWDLMWADDALWLPPALKNQFVTGRFVFDGEGMREAEIEVRDRPPGPISG